MNRIRQSNKKTWISILIGLDENQNDEFILFKIDHHIPNFEYLKRETPDWS
jgi:hypothetical protein